MTIPDKGLPFHKRPYEFGNLFVLFKVKFPDNLTDEQMTEVNKTLAPSKKKKN